MNLFGTRHSRKPKRDKNISINESDEVWVKKLSNFNQINYFVHLIVKHKTLYEKLGDQWSLLDATDSKVELTSQKKWNQSMRSWSSQSCSSSWDALKIKYKIRDWNNQELLWQKNF